SLSSILSTPPLALSPPSLPDALPIFCVLAASDSTILPPELGFALARNGTAGGKGAVLALVGPEYAMGKAFLALQGEPELGRQDRSEEHTSELQSRGQLVCRLLLEKKK